MTSVYKAPVTSVGPEWAHIFDKSVGEWIRQDTYRGLWEQVELTHVIFLIYCDFHN